MLRLSSFAAVALVVDAHAQRLCSELEVRDGALVAPVACSDPAWVQYFSVAAAGPEQISINYGRSVDEMVIGWVTADMAAASTVQFGTAPGTYTRSATGNASFYKYSASYTSGLIHHTTLTGLAPNTTYYYIVGEPGSWSAEFAFTSNPGVGPIFPFTFGFLADVGEGSDPMATVAHMVTRLPNIDAISINGDLSYASGCESSGCATWDAFQRMVQPLSSVRSWTINLGNHETYDSANGIVAISARTRYAGMPYPVGSADDSWYFSYEAGPAHVISVSSFYPGGFGPASPQTIWLKADLASVDRAKTPWLLVVVHAPWYNSNTEHQGDGEDMRVAYEPLLLAAKANAVFSGHVHAYERSKPVSNNVVQPDGSGMVHFNIGDGGASAYTSWEPLPAWSAFRQAVYGHGEFQILNATAALWTWHRNQDQEPAIMDSYLLRQ